MMAVALHWRTMLIAALLAITLACIVGIRHSWTIVGKARAETAEALQGQKEALEHLKQEQASHLATLETLEARDRQRAAIQSKYQSASRELERLRRTNAEIKNWADRPIPADVIRLLSDRADGDGSGVPARNVATGLPRADAE